MQGVRLPLHRKNAVPGNFGPETRAAGHTYRSGVTPIPTTGLDQNPETAFRGVFRPLVAGAAIDFAEHANETHRDRVCKTIVDRLGLAACGDQTLGPHLGEML